MNNSPVRIHAEFGSTSEEEDDAEEELLNKDEEFRRKAENRRIIAALQTDEAAANPFENFLEDFAEDEQVLKMFLFWRDVEKLREKFSYCIKNYEFHNEFVSLIVFLYLLVTEKKLFLLIIKNELVLQQAENLNIGCDEFCRNFNFYLSLLRFFFETIFFRKKQ